MSQQLMLELSDEAYADLQQKASAVGLSATEWILTLLNTQPQNEAILTNQGKELARKGFRKYAGVLRADAVGSLDNNDIDADLVKAYENQY